MLAFIGWALCVVLLLAVVAMGAGLEHAGRVAAELRAIASEEARAAMEARREAFWLRQRATRAELLVRAWAAAGPLGVAAAASRSAPVSRPLSPPPSGPLTRG